MCIYIYNFSKCALLGGTKFYPNENTLCTTYIYIYIYITHIEPFDAKTGIQTLRLRISEGLWLLKVCHLRVRMCLLRPKRGQLFASGGIDDVPRNVLAEVASGVRKNT